MNFLVEDLIPLLEARGGAEICNRLCGMLQKRFPKGSFWLIFLEDNANLIAFASAPQAPVQQRSSVVTIGKRFSEWGKKECLEVLKDLDFAVTKSPNLSRCSLGGFGHLLIDKLQDPVSGQTLDAGVLCRLVTPLLQMQQEMKKLKHLARFSEKTESRMAALIAELRQARQRAEDANRTKSVFLANISHELRTPLNGVLGLGEVLEGTVLDAHQQSLLRNLNESGQDLRHLIDNLLDFSQIEGRNLVLDEEPVDRESLVLGLALSLRTKTAADVELTTEVSPSIPRFICADPIRLRQILHHLLGNAVKFTPSGRIVLRVDCKEPKEGEPSLIHFEIEDTGKGIPAEKQERIFDAFYQVDSGLSRAHDGIGLGLSITKRLVEMMGGRLRFNSELGKGSKFWFKLKLLTSNDLESFLGGECDPGKRPQTKQIRILLVEDNHVNQMVTQRILHKLDCDVEIANNGQEALDLMHDQHYDLVLMDVSMPVMDGLEATQHIRTFDTRENQHTIIVALTAHAMEGDREKCLAAGMDDYLSKPARAEQLQKILAKWIK